jgi:hypothetical protein
VVLRPVGPQSPGVYWFRRVLVALLVLALVGGLWWLFGSRGGDDPTPVAGTTTPTESASPTPTSSSPSPTASSPSPKPSKKASPTTTRAPDCRAQDMSVTVSTDAEVYPADVEPSFSLTVANESETTCRRDVGQQALELRVSSRGSRVWSSDDCSPDGGKDVVEFEPGESVSQTVTWSRQTSQPGCPDGEPFADPGQYEVLARNLKLLSEPATFTLQGG